MSQVSCSSAAGGPGSGNTPIWDTQLLGTGKRSNDSALPDTSCYCSEETEVISTHMPLAKESHMAKPKVNKVGKGTPPMGKHSKKGGENCEQITQCAQQSER